MNEITLRQLRYFDALAAHGHFGRAAEACAISQPALSLQIKELELSAGAALVERGPRQIRLTALGERFAQRARDILRAVEELGELARAAGDGLSGPLRLGVIPTIAQYLLPDIIRDMARKLPKVELHPRETMTRTLIADLLDGQLDLALLALPISEPALHEEPLFDEEFLLVRPESQSRTPLPPLDALKEARLLLLEEGHCFRDQALAFCGIGPTRPARMIEGNSLSTLVQMVGAGIGVTLIPQMAAAVETRSADVCVSRFAAPAPQRRIGLVWRRTTPMAPHFAQLAQIISRIGQARIAPRSPG